MEFYGQSLAVIQNPLGFMEQTPEADALFRAQPERCILGSASAIGFHAASARGFQEEKGLFRRSGRPSCRLTQRIALLHPFFAAAMSGEKNLSDSLNGTV